MGMNQIIKRTKDTNVLTPDEIYFKVKDLAKRKALQSPEANEFFAEHGREILEQERALRVIAPTAFKIADMFKDIDLEESG